MSFTWIVKERACFFSFIVSFVEQTQSKKQKTHRAADKHKHNIAGWLKWRRVRTSCEAAVAVVAAAAVEEGSRPDTAGLGSTACTAVGCPGGELDTGQK